MPEEETVNTPEVSPNEDSGHVVDTEATPVKEEGHAEQGTDDQKEEHPQKEDSEAGKKEEGKDEEVNYEKRYKDLQSEFTKTREQLKEHKNWREQLKGNPHFQQWAASLKEQAQQQQKPDFDNMSEEERFNYLVDQRVNERLNKEVKPYIDSTMQKEANETLNRFFNDNPDAKGHDEEIAEVMTKYNMPINEAWKYLGADTAEEKAKQKALEELEAKKKANVEMPKSKPSSPSIKKGMSVEEAFKLAQQSLNK